MQDIKPGIFGTAEMAAVDGRKVELAIRAHDESDLIGGGRHERVVVTVANFQTRVDAKARRGA